MSPPEPESADHRSGRLVGGEVVTAISNAMTRLHRRQFGRGPGSTRTYIGDNIIVSVLSDVYTPVERTLIEIGKRETVRDTRLSHQLAVEGEYTRAVEEVTGRDVVSFHSTVGFEPDVAIEIFMLAEAPPPGAA